VLSVAATAAAMMSAVPVLAVPGEPPADSAEAAREVDRLFADAERAIEAYNGSAERVAELREEFERRRDRVSRGQRAVNEMRRTLGSAAAAQYRAGGFAPAVTLMFADSPETYLARAAVLERIRDRRAGDLRDLLAAQRALDQRRAEAGDKLDELIAEQERLAAHRNAARRELAAARREYEQLSAAERRERERANRAAVREAPPAPVDRDFDEPVSDRAAQAVAAAREAVGRPYAWGQAGPASFDCSGLIQWAWARAGVFLPRTSQAQAGAGRRVALADARPGDIVVYRSDASHVGMYVGGGQMVHAPYPGAQVRYESVGVMPVSSVVRP
jgi:cell wall-associated NlpC family hydrolase